MCREQHNNLKEITHKHKPMRLVVDFEGMHEINVFYIKEHFIVNILKP